MSDRCVETTRFGIPRILIVAVLLLLAVPVGRCADSSSDSSLTLQPQTARLNPDLSLNQYDYREWTMQDGLPSNQVLDIVQTHDGYLWLATERGLARFDGLKFTQFNRSNTPAFVTNQITELCKGRDAALWIGTQRGGLIRCRLGQPPVFQHFDELLGQRIHCLFEDRDGTLWIGTEAETWTLADGKCSPRPGAPLNVRAICDDENGTLWLGASIWMTSRPDSLASTEIQPRPGLYRLDEDRFYRFTEADGFPATLSDNSITALCSDNQGGLWVGTLGNPLLHYRDGKFLDHAADIGTKASQYLNLHQDRGGQLWISTFASGFFRRVGDKATKLPIGIRPVRCIAEDREGNLWYGGAHRGLRCISNPELARVKLDNGAGTMRCVLEDSAGDLWLGGGNPFGKNNRQIGLHRLRDGGFENFGTDHGLPTHLVTGLAKGPDGRLWIGTNKGLVCRDKGTMTTFTTKEGLGRNWIRAVYADRDGVIWIGFWEGSLQRMENGTFTTIAEFGDADVNWFHQDASGVLWIGSNRGLHQWHDGKVQRISDLVLDKLPTISFTACYEDDEGNLWIGTDGGGLCRYAAGRYSNWTSEQGLHEDAINAIAKDTRGSLWLGGPHGLTSLPVESLDALDTGTLDRLEVRGHPIEVGNDQHRIGPDYRPNVVCRNDGSIWFVTTRGAVVVPPDGPDRHPLPPLVHVEDVRANGDSHGVNAPLEVISGTRRIDFHFTANSFAASKRVRFRYRLDGYDDVWIDAGTQRSASYTDVRPGQYVFRVTADNGYGVWSEQDAVMALTVNPRWWEITWLRVAALLASIAAVIGYFRHRMRKVRKANIALRHEIADRQRAEEESRINVEQLARVSRAASMGELTTSIAHEVKQPLYAIVSNAQTAIRLMDAEQPDTAMLRETLIDIASAGKRAADIIDHVRSMTRKEHRANHHLDLNQVVGDVIKLVDPELRKRQLSIRTELAAFLPTVRGDPVELQQAILNLIINGAQAMSHGDTRSPEILVATSTGNGYVELAVTDAGTGLSETEPDQMFEPFFTTKADGTGMGLAINRTIIEAHGGRIWATPNADRGTTFRFCLPITSEDGQ